MQYSNLTQEQVEEKLVEVVGDGDVGHKLWEAIRQAYFKQEWQEAIDIGYILAWKHYFETHFPQSGMLIVAREELGHRCSDYPYAAENLRNGKMPAQEMVRFDSHCNWCEVCRHRLFVIDLDIIYEKSCKALREGDLEGFHELHQVRQMPEYTVDRYLLLTFHRANKAMEQRNYAEVIRLANNMTLLQAQGKYPVEKLLATAKEALGEDGLMVVKDSE